MSQRNNEKAIAGNTQHPVPSTQHQRYLTQIKGETIMNTLIRQIHLMALALAAMALVCMGAGQAFAQLPPQEQTEIETAAADGDVTAVEAAVKKAMKRLMAEGGNPETIARQASSVAVLAAINAGEDFAAIAEAASSGATSGAVEAALEMGQDAAAAAKSASAGSRAGAVQAAQQTGQDVNALERASLKGSRQAEDLAQEEFDFMPEEPELEPLPEPEEPMTEDEQDPSPSA